MLNKPTTPISIQNQIRLAKEQNHSKIFLTNNHLSHFPEELLELSNLRLIGLQNRYYPSHSWDYWKRYSYNSRIYFPASQFRNIRP